MRRLAVGLAVVVAAVAGCGGGSEPPPLSAEAAAACGRMPAGNEPFPSGKEYVRTWSQLTDEQGRQSLVEIVAIEQELSVEIAQELVDAIVDGRCV